MGKLLFSFCLFLTFVDILRLVSGASKKKFLCSLSRVDWGVRGFWDFQREVLFDIRILNADAPSYLSNSLASIFDSARVEKKTKYSKAAEDRRASFTPFLSTCEAIFDHEAIVYFKKLSNLLSSKWIPHIPKYTDG